MRRLFKSKDLALMVLSYALFLTLAYLYLPRRSKEAPPTPTPSHLELIKQKALFAPPSPTSLTLENDSIKACFDEKDGRITEITLKNFQEYHQSTPIKLFDGTSDALQLLVLDNANGQEGWINAHQLACTTTTTATPEGTQIICTYKKGADWIKQTFLLPKQGYQLSTAIEVSPSYAARMEDSTTPPLKLVWYAQPTLHEKHLETSVKETNIQYAKADGSLQELKQTNNQQEEKATLEGVSWITVNQPFFLQAIIDINKQLPQAEIALQQPPSATPQALKQAGIEITLAPHHLEGHPIHLYFGPNDYHHLKEVHPSFAKTHYLGPKLIRPINKYILLPLANYLHSLLDDYVLVLLCIVLLLAVALFFLTYQPHVNSIKVDALEPILKRLKEECSKKESSKTYKVAEMELYQRAGVNPVKVIVPMLLQIPLFIAVINFVRYNIALRQLPFLWIDDLSTYDDLLQLPFQLPFIGSSLSLIGLLTTLVGILSTYLKKNPTTTHHKPLWSVGLPLFMLMFFDKFSSGWWIYRLFSNLAELLQYFACKLLVNESALAQETIRKAHSAPLAESRNRNQIRLEKRLSKKE